MRGWGVAVLTGSGDRDGRAGGLERSTPLLLSSSSSSSSSSRPSPRGAPDRRSLIGNEPWSHSLSRDQQIATTYRLWRGDASPRSPTSISPWLPSSLPRSSSLTPGVYGEFMIYPGQCRGQGRREHRSILLLRMCQTPHLLYSNLACPDTQPELTNPHRVATFAALRCTCAHASCHDILNGQTVKKGNPPSHSIRVLGLR